ncbi:AraC family transcriptional regulator [Arenicella chitinivorans]|uniref:AraC family transcriptional regulator n=1 Tax=Arenicella chitinivorans TaxID=1329800 RepID=A0A918RFG4_9GAMM|nr:AraC family transcriptional regulator [Arenicella chitinivorans]GGZ96740.1 AraC family transcriptional regulator [Arenicella chitinivorans]
MRWVDRIRLVIEYVEENLVGEISIDDAAKIACCSKFHLNRVFFSYFDTTFSEYVRRRRFTLAAADVVSTQATIVNIAMKYGYTSPNAFTRSFRKIHGVNPSEVRSANATITTYRKASFPLEPVEVERMEYKIVEKASFNIVGKSKRFEFDDFTKNGKKFWKEYVGSDGYKSLCELTDGKPGLVSGSPLLTAYFPDEKKAQDKFLDVLGVEYDTGDKATTFETHSVPAATYAEFDCLYRGAMKTNRYIYSEWFSATGYERDGSKPDIVAYFPMPWRHFSEMRVRWWVPIIKNSDGV